MAIGQAVDIQDQLKKSAQTLRKIEAVDLRNILKQLQQYLIILANDHSLSFCEIISNHLNDQNSWLYLANTIISLPDELKAVESVVLSSEAGYCLTMLKDLSRQLKYYQDKFSKEEDYQALVHIVKSISEFANQPENNDNLRAQFKEYLLAETQANTELFNKEQAWGEAKLAKLLKASLVHQFKNYLRISKRALLQCDIFFSKYTKQITAAMSLAKPSVIELDGYLAKLVNASKSDLLKIKQSVQGNNPQLDQELVAQEVQLDYQRNAASDLLNEIEVAFTSGDSLLGKDIVERFFKKFDTAKVGLLIDKFEENNEASAIKGASQLKNWQSKKQKVMNLLMQREQSLGNEEHQKKVAFAHKLYLELESKLFQVNALTDNAKQAISLIKQQLSCATKMKECYRKYALADVFKHVTAELQKYKNEISAIKHAVNLKLQWDLLDLSPEKIVAMEAEQKLATQNLNEVQAKIDEYLNVINYNTDDYPQRTLPAWQTELTNMIISSNSEVLAGFFTQLGLIKLVENKYLRAILIIRFNKVGSKFNERIARNMKEWQHKHVDQVVVNRTFNYIGLKVNTESLQKAVPTMVPTKKPNVLVGMTDSVIDWVSALPEFLGISQKRT